MSVKTPARSAVVAALSLLGAPTAGLAAFPTHPDDWAFSFADALIDSPAAIYTDWRFHPAEALDEAWQRLHPHGVEGTIEEEDEESGFPEEIVLQHADVAARYRILIKDEEPCLHEIFFALDKVLPAGLKIMSLLPYEVTDSYLHILEPAAVFDQVHALLGDWFAEVLVSHDSQLSFVRISGDA